MLSAKQVAEIRAETGHRWDVIAEKLEEIAAELSLIELYDAMLAENEKSRIRLVPAEAVDQGGVQPCAKPRLIHSAERLSK